MRIPASSLLTLCCVISLSACDTRHRTAGGKSIWNLPPPPPTRVVPQLAVFAAEPVRFAWANCGERVSVLPVRKALVPGQKLAIAILAEGERSGRETLLRSATFTFRIRSGEQEIVVGPLRATVVKAIKVRGADQVLAAFDAGGLDQGDRKTVLEMTTQISAAVFLPDWTAPEVEAEQVIEIQGEVTLASGEKVALAAAQLSVKTWATAGAPFNDLKSLQSWMNGYALAPEPQHLGAAIKLAAAANAPMEALAGFHVAALKAAPAGTAPAMVKALLHEDELARVMGANVLRWAGQDASTLLASLPAIQRQDIERAQELPDAYVLTATPSEVMSSSRKMDMLWGEFMATGRPQPIRAIVDLLRYRDDYPVLVEAAKTPNVKKEPTDALARAVLYRTAGWSLNSFVVTSPIAADYVAHWQQDEAVPPVIREELRRLRTNEAFRPQGQKTGTAAPSSTSPSGS